MTINKPLKFKEGIKSTKTVKHSSKEFGTSTNGTFHRRTATTTGQSKKADNVQLKVGEGRIVSNENTVQGFETLFVQELKTGDIIGVNHPTSLTFEERTVTSILSQRTMTIDMPFSTDLISKTAYMYFTPKDSSPLPAGSPNEEDDRVPDPSSQIIKIIKEQQPSKLVLREKTGMWTYTVRTQELDKDYTAEELLDMRIKRTGRDKYC